VAAAVPDERDNSLARLSNFNTDIKVGSTIDRKSFLQFLVPLNANVNVNRDLRDFARRRFHGSCAEQSLALPA